MSFVGHQNCKYVDQVYVTNLNDHQYEECSNSPNTGILSAIYLLNALFMWIVIWIVILLGIYMDESDNVPISPINKQNWDGEYMYA